VEVSPYVRRSADSRAMEISKVKEEKGGCVEAGGRVEVSPNVRKSAELGAMEASKVRGGDRWMCRGFPQPVQNVAVQRHMGSDSSC